MSNIRTVTVSWVGESRFEGITPDGEKSQIDTDGPTAPGPMHLVLMAAAGCTGADVLEIAKKMRVDLTRFEVEVSGTRREEYPKRYVAIHMVFRMAGDGLTEVKARRAIDLSLSTYCSVVNSLASDIPITYDLELS
ncbi:MAG: OsmC family peroxiredoxin [Gemmatimonadales bacterium]|nr:MAG: OsmC family peroxiredoxin [Gemmatimonadales bacterium]